MHSQPSGHGPQRRRLSALALTASLLAAAPLLTACGEDARPGAAAVVGGERITVAQLESRVDEVRDAQRTATGGGPQYAQAVARSGGMTRGVLHTMVLDRVLHRAAEDAGVGVSRRETQKLRGELEQQAGGSKALESSWLQQFGVAPARLDESLRSEIEIGKLSEKVGADMNTKAGQDKFWKLLSQTSEKLGIDINPRYGTWDVERSRRADATTPWLREVTKEGEGRA